MAVSTQAPMNARIKDVAMYDLALLINNRTSNAVYWVDYGEQDNMSTLTTRVTPPGREGTWWR